MTSTTFQLGDRTVHRIGYGAMQLPGPGVMGPPRDRDEAIRVLRRAVELGVDHIDTAQYYGPVVANELIREALHPYPDNLAIVSKVGAFRDDQGGWIPAQKPAELRQGVEENLRTLETEQLAAVNLRLMPAGDESADVVPLEDQLAEMVALRDEGKIAGIGLSTASLEQVETAIGLAGIVTVQTRSAWSTGTTPRSSPSPPSAASPTRRTSLWGRPSRGCPRSPTSPRSARSPSAAVWSRARSAWPGCWPSRRTCC